MKYIFLLLFIFCQSNASSQDGTNLLTQEEYQQVKVNNVPLQDIIFFKGGEAEISELLNMPIKVDSHDPEVLTFKNEYLLLVYGNEMDQRTMYYLEILNDTTRIEIKGNAVRLGASISELGLWDDLNSKPLKNGSFCAFYKREKDDAFISIEFDADSKLIRKIYYFSPT